MFGKYNNPYNLIIKKDICLQKNLPNKFYFNQRKNEPAQGTNLNDCVNKTMN